MASDGAPDLPYTREQLLAALIKEHEHLIHDDFDPDADMSNDEYTQYVHSLPSDELVLEIKEMIAVDNLGVDDFGKTDISAYMSYWLQK